MKSRKSLYWLAAPALMAAMITQAAPGEQMQQHQQTQQRDQDQVHQMNQDNMQQTNSADMQDCARMKSMDKSRMDMNDPAVQQKMQKCMKMMHGDKIMGGQMQKGGDSSPESE